MTSSFPGPSALNSRQVSTPSGTTNFFLCKETFFFKCLSSKPEDSIACILRLKKTHMSTLWLNKSQATRKGSFTWFLPFLPLEELCQKFISLRPLTSTHYKHRCSLIPPMVQASGFCVFGMFYILLRQKLLKVRGNVLLSSALHIPSTETTSQYMLSKHLRANDCGFPVQQWEYAPAYVCFCVWHPLKKWGLCSSWGTANFIFQGQRVVSLEFMVPTVSMEMILVAPKQPQTICKSMGMAVFWENFLYRLYSEKTFFTDTEVSVSCHFHLSNNILLMIFLQPFKQLNAILGSQDLENEVAGATVDRFLHYLGLLVPILVVGFANEM